MNLDFPSHINLPEDTRSELVQLLNENLAASVDLFTQVKHAHWNVKGKHFISRHELFDDLAKHLRHHADDLAERVAALGGYAEGTARLVARNSQLSEFDLDAVVGDDHLAALIEGFGRYCSAFREAIDRCAELNDPVTEDLFTNLLGEAEKDLWFLESHSITGRRREFVQEKGEERDDDWRTARAPGTQRSARPSSGSPEENREGGPATAEAEEKEYDEGESERPWEEPSAPPH